MSDTTAAGDPPTTLPVPAMTGSLLITCEYNPAPENGTLAGLAWVILHDNPVYAWMVDTTGGRPVSPIILGTLPDWSPPPTAPVVSPRWAVREVHEIYIPDTARGDVTWFLNFIAFNNGAQRQLYAVFADASLATAWNQWTRDNPTLTLSAPPNV
jgi:hypothetical protein